MKASRRAQSASSLVGIINQIQRKNVEFSILTDELSLELDEALREGEKLGFRKYEVRCIDSYEERVPNIRPERLDQLIQQVERDRIEVTALTPGIFKIDFSDANRIRIEIEDTFQKTCQMAVQLSSSKIIVFGFMRGGGGSEEEVVELLQEAGRMADQFNLKLAVENEPGSFCDTGVNTAAIIKAVGAENVGINWDPANAVIAGEAAYPVGYEAILPYLLNVHIKDSIPIPPDKWENRLIGDGGVNWLGQLSALKRDATLDCLTLETHVFPVLESTEEDVRRLHILLDTIEKLND